MKAPLIAKLPNYEIDSITDFLAKHCCFNDGTITSIFKYETKLYFRTNSSNLFIIMQNEFNNKFVLLDEDIEISESEMIFSNY